MHMYTISIENTSLPKMPAKEKRPKPTQGRDTYDRILEEIRTGALTPGDRLTETELATRLGISRTPVREALRELEADGLVTQTPRFGATVRQLSYSEVSELYEMRTVLESTAARFAARVASDVEIDELGALHEAMCHEPNNTLRYQLNQQFHHGLRNAARNRFLLSASQSIEKTLLILGPSTLNEPERFTEANKEHAALLNALQERQPADAEQAMRKHIESAHSARLRQLRTLDS